MEGICNNYVINLEKTSKNIALFSMKIAFSITYRLHIDYIRIIYFFNIFSISRGVICTTLNQRLLDCF